MLSFDAADFERQIANAVQDIERAVEEAGEEAVEAVGRRGLEIKIEEIERGTYAKPEPRGSRRTGSRRTGALRRGQRLEGERGERRIEPGTAYEEHLARLPTGRDGVNRSNPAAANAAARLEEEAEAIAERAIEDSLGRSLGM